MNSRKRAGKREPSPFLTDLLGSFVRSADGSFALAPGAMNRLIETLALMQARDCKDAVSHLVLASSLMMSRASPMAAKSLLQIAAQGMERHPRAD